MFEVGSVPGCSSVQDPVGDSLKGAEDKNDPINSTALTVSSVCCLTNGGSFVSYLVVEPSVQSVRLVLGFSSLLGSSSLHLGKSLINPAEKVFVDGY